MFDRFKRKSTKLGDLKSDVELKRCLKCPREQRPCLADKKPATFHRWTYKDQVLLRFTSEECSPKYVRETFALVEYPDGSVEKVNPELIQFLDRKEACNDE